MAVPTLVPGFTILSDCDTNTGWSAGTVDNEVVKQGSASLSGILRQSPAIQSRTFTTTTFNATGQHLRMWLNYASIGFLQTQANGGIRLFIQDTGGSIGYWYLGGIDTYDGGWTLLTVDCDTAFDAGTANRTSINRVGFALQLTGSPRNAINTWYDFLVRGNGLTITGGTAADPITWAGIAAVDAAAGYGAVRRQNGVYFVSTNLVFGGAGSTVLDDDNQIVVFENQPVNPNLYKIEAIGAGDTQFKLRNSVLKSASTNTRFDLLLNGAQLDTLQFMGNTVASADEVRFKSGQSVSGNVFQGCNQIQTGGASFQSNTVSGSTDTAGALLWPGGTTVTECNFVDNTRAVQHTDAGTFSYIGMTFNGNTYDIHNSSGGAVVINASGGSNPFTSIESAGGSTTINNTVTLTITGIVPGSEVRIFEHGTINELGGVETIVGTSFAFSYNFGSVSSVDIVVHKPTYVHLRVSAVTLGANDSSIPVTQRFDRVYSNPI